MALPSNWITAKLSDVLELNQSGIWGDEAKGDSSDYPVLRSTNIQLGKMVLDNIAYRSVRQELVERYALANGDILVTKSSGSAQLLGKNIIFETPSEGNTYLYSNFTQRLRAKSADLLPHYLYYYLNSTRAARFLEQMQSTTSGLRNLDMQQYVSQIIPLPPLSEQRHIVNILRQVDDLRRLRAEALDKSRQMVPALFRNMFGEPTSQKRWPVVPVSYFVKEFRGGKSILSEVRDTTESGYSVLKVSAVTWQNYRPEESKAAPLSYIPPHDHIVRGGDLLFSRANTTELVGATVYVFETPPKMLLSDKLWRFVWRDPEVIEPLFVWRLFLDASIRRELSQRATGSGGSMKNISMSRVLSMTVPFPPIDIQRQFAVLVKELRAAEQIQLKSSRELEKIYQSMLAQAFTGKLTEDWRQEQDEFHEVIDPYQQDVIGDEHLYPMVDSIDPIINNRGVALRTLSSWQHEVWLRAHHTKGYFTPQNLASESGIDLGKVEDGLRLLASAGLVIAALVPVAPAGRTVYVPAYRAVTDSDLTSAVEDLPE